MGETPPVVVAWQEDLKQTRSNIKSMAGCTTKFAADVTPRSGYTMWDWLNAMHHNRGFRHVYNGQTPNVLPFLFRNPPTKKWEGAPRVLTPTVKVNRSSAITGTFGSFVSVIPNTEVWDTNDFWRPSDHPERLTFRAQGMYLVMIAMHGYRNGSTEIAFVVKKNGVALGITAHDIGNANFAATAIAVFPYYFVPGDYLTVELACNPSGAFYFLDDFSAVAITPEAIY